MTNHFIDTIKNISTNQYYSLLFSLIAIYTGFKGIMAIAKSFLGEKKKRNI